MRLEQLQEVLLWDGDLVVGAVVAVGVAKVSVVDAVRAPGAMAGPVQGLTVSVFARPVGTVRRTWQVNPALNRRARSVARG